MSCLSDVVPDVGALEESAAAQSAGPGVALPDHATMISVLTHDLRNPLNALSGWLQIMAMDGACSSGPMRRAVQGAQAAVAQQAAQIASLSRVLQAYGGQPEPARYPIELAPLLARVVAQWRERAPSGSPSVAELASPAQPRLQVWGEGAALEQALFNLGALALRQGPAMARLEVHLDAVGWPRVQLRCAGGAPGAPVWAALEGPGAQLSLDILDALAVLHAMGAQLQRYEMAEGVEALEIVWVGGTSTNLKGNR